MFVLLLMLAAGCSSESASATAKVFSGKHPIKVVCSTGMVGDLARNVGGPDVAVTDLFQPGVDPHTYRASTTDLRLLQSADIIVYNGLHLEGKMGAVFEKLGRTVPCLAVGDSLANKSPSELLRDGEHSDPHIWFDVSLWAKMADVVAERFARFDPARADEYRRRGQEYRGRLEKLDLEVAERLAEIPKDRRILVTSHDAFRYFGRRYDVEVRGIQGVSTEAEASVAHVGELVEFLSKAKVKAVFVESSVNPRGMQALIEGCKARGHVVRQGGELFSDAMGDSGTPEGTYEGMIRHNVRTIVEALK